MTFLARWLCIAMLVCLLPRHAIADDHATGEWTGVLSPPGAQLTLVVRIRVGDGGRPSGELESVDQAPGDQLALAQIAVSPDRLAFSIPSIGATYEATWSSAEQLWSGVFRQGMALPLVLRRGAPPATAVVDGVDGTWRGAVRRGDTTLRLVLHVVTTSRGTRVTLDSPDLGALGLRVEGFARAGATVRLRVPAAQVAFSGTLDGTHLRGRWSRQGQPDADVVFERDAAAPAAPVRTQWPIVARGYRAEDVSFANPDDRRVTLAGTLTIPDGPGPFPAAVLISGSGPQDRDETLYGHKPFAVLADHLSRHGIAVLRYDDRGFGASTGDHGSATSADFATDARAAVRYLLGRAEIDRAAIGLIGHSEGGVIGPLAAVVDRHVGFLVMLAGPGTSTEQLVLSQRRQRSGVAFAQGLSQAQLDRTEPIVRSILRAARGAPDADQAVARVRALLTPEALQALGAGAAERDAIALEFSGAWMRYFLRYDPAAVLPRVRVPVLALNGARDRQVPAPENLAALRHLFAHHPDATILELPGLNHLFQPSATGALDEYERIPETFAPSAMALISDWIAARFGHRPPG